MSEQESVTELPEAKKFYGAPVRCENCGWISKEMLFTHGHTIVGTNCPVCKCMTLKLDT